MSGERTRTLSASSSTTEPVKRDGRLNRCRHWVIIKRVCCICKKLIEEEDNGPGTLAFDYLFEGLRLSDESVKFIRQLSTETFSSKKKLHLVLDLDNTLIHSCRIHLQHLNEKEKQLVNVVGSRDDLAIITLHLVKLRPFVREFLRKAKELFVMHVCTKGSRDYAEEIVRLLDPQGIYFKNRVITRREMSGEFKSLDHILAEEHSVIIIDDLKKVWPDIHRPNLLEIKEYRYFKKDTESKLESLLLLESEQARSSKEKIDDEDEKNGALANVLEFLEGFHAEFFREETEKRDVRKSMMRYYFSCKLPHLRFFQPCI